MNEDTPNIGNNKELDEFMAEYNSSFPKLEPNKQALNTFAHNIAAKAARENSPKVIEDKVIFQKETIGFFGRIKYFLFESPNKLVSQLGLAFAFVIVISAVFYLNNSSKESEIIAGKEIKTELQSQGTPSLSPSVADTPYIEPPDTHYAKPVDIAQEDQNNSHSKFNVLCTIPLEFESRAFAENENNEKNSQNIYQIIGNVLKTNNLDYKKVKGKIITEWLIYKNEITRLHIRPSLRSKAITVKLESRIAKTEDYKPKNIKYLGLMEEIEDAVFENFK